MWCKIDLIKCDQWEDFPNSVQWKAKNTTVLLNVRSAGIMMLPMIIFKAGKIENSHVMSWGNFSNGSVSKCQKDANLSKRCLVVKKVSICQNAQKMSNCQNNVKWEEVHKRLHTMRFTHNDVNCDVTSESHQNWSKTYLMTILRNSLNQERVNTMPEILRFKCFIGCNLQGVN